MAPFSGSSGPNYMAGGVIALVAAGVAVVTSTLLVGGTVQVKTANNASLNIKSISEEITLDGQATTDSTANLIPGDSIIYGVTARVTTISVASATAKIGDAGTDDKFAAAGTQLDLGVTTNSLKLNSPLTPYAQATAAKVRITPDDGGNATGTKVRVSTFYVDLTEPTN